MFKFILRYYLPFNLLFDVFTSTIWQSNVTTASIRGLILTSIIFVGWFKESQSKIFLPFMVITFYVMLLFPFATNFLESLRLSSKFFFTIWAFPVFYVHSHLFTSKVIKRNIFILSVILVANYVVSTLFGIGGSAYTESNEFLVGSLADSWLIYSYVLFLYIIILKTKDIKGSAKLIYLVMFALIVLQLILGLKRTAIIVFFMGIVMFLYLEKVNIKTIFTMTFGLFFILVLLNQYSDVFESRMYARGDRVQGNYKDIVESEYRYLESIYVWEKVLSFENIPESLFGFEAYNSRGNYGTSNLFGERFLHVDYNIIVNTTGLVGLFLYFYLFYFIYQRYKEKKIYLDYKYRELFLIIFFTQFFASIGGQMLSISFGSIKFAFMAIAIKKLR